MIKITFKLLPPFKFVNPRNIIKINKISEIKIATRRPVSMNTAYRDPACP